MKASSPIFGRYKYSYLPAFEKYIRKLFFVFAKVYESYKTYLDGAKKYSEISEKAYYDVAFKKQSTDNVLALLVTGSSIEQYTENSNEDSIVDAVIQELDTIFEGKASSSFTGEYKLIDWGGHPYTLGTWVEGFRINKSTIKELNRPIENKLYFAGEAHDVYRQMGVPGAILSGLHTVDLMLSEVLSVTVWELRAHWNLPGISHRLPIMFATLL